MFSEIFFFNTIQSIKSLISKAFVLYFSFIQMQYQMRVFLRGELQICISNKI